MSADQTPGYDIAAVEKWLSTRLPALAAPYVWTKLEGGHSNLTYRIDGADGAKAAVIRRPPMGDLLPKAHDMGREWACISALWGRVPVAEPLAFCESPDVTGAHFYVMGLVEAKAMYGRADVEAWIPAENRIKAAESWIDALAALHSLDIDEIGLGDLGKRDGYIERQMKTWYRSWNASVEAAEIDESEDAPEADAEDADAEEAGDAEEEDDGALEAVAEMEQEAEFDAQSSDDDTAESEDGPETSRG